MDEDTKRQFDGVVEWTKTTKEDTMTEGKSSTVDIDAVRRENALIGYQMAINLWIHKGAQCWERFNIMLLVNSIIIGAIGLTISGAAQPAFALPLAIVGLLLCGNWFVLMRRETEYTNYYVLSARELEEKYLSDPIKTVSRGGFFAEGSTVTIEIDGAPFKRRMSKCARILRARHAANVVIGILTLVYIAIIILNAGVTPFGYVL